MARREYPVSITVNNIKISKVVIDPHYEVKHSDSIDDDLILKLVEKLGGRSFDPDDVNEPFLYFVADQLEFDDKLYKLIWLLEKDRAYIGVVNAYRRSQ